MVSMAWPGPEPLWLVAPHVPEWLNQAYTPTRFGPGCYRVEPLGHCFQRLLKKEVEKGIEQHRLVEACAAVRRVLAHRQLALSPDDDARIEACTDLATLERSPQEAGGKQGPPRCGLT